MVLKMMTALLCGFSSMALLANAEQDFIQRELDAAIVAAAGSPDDARFGKGCVPAGSYCTSDSDCCDAYCMASAMSINICYPKSINEVAELELEEEVVPEEDYVQDDDEAESSCAGSWCTDDSMCCSGYQCNLSGQDGRCEQGLVGTSFPGEPELIMVTPAVEIDVNSSEE